MKEAYPLMQIVDAKGEFTSAGNMDEWKIDQIKLFYYHMVRIRMYDKKGKALQRQGRIGTYVPFEGQEAAQVGSALALHDDDWLFPTYRDHGATLTFGADMDRLFLYWNGRMEGVVPSYTKNIFPAAVPIATQIPNATGVAMAETYKGTNRGTLVYFGDGATSEGDFHEGLNIASVFQAPVVFFNQNNGYAISLPVEKQMNSETIAQKSVGYGIPGIRVDGMDVLAVYQVVSEALDRARNGGGPTLIEAVVHRFGPHTTADDPSKYRNQDQMGFLREKVDPILRIERLMKQHQFWDAAWAEETINKIESEINEAVATMESYGKPNPAHMFDYVFKEPTWTIAEQKRDLLGEEAPQ